MKSFVTGSHKYGVPHEGSDVDLVVLISEEDMKILKEASDKTPIKGYDDVNANLRFGPLNLICLTSDEDFATWKYSTMHRCCQSRDTDKKKTVGLFKMYQTISKKFRDTFGPGKSKEPERAVSNKKIFQAIEDMAEILRESGDERAATCLSRAAELLELEPSTAAVRLKAEVGDED